MDFHLINTLTSLKNYSEKESEIRKLIQITNKLALTIISKRDDSSKFIYVGENSFNDLATDSITPLFTQDRTGELPLRKALMKWDKEINDDASAYYFLYKIINSRIDQESTRKLKEADPIFAKILRSYSHLIETGRLNKAYWFGIPYLLPKNQFMIEQKPIDHEFLEKLPISYFQGTSEKIIAALFHSIRSEHGFIEAVPLNALIRKIKHTNASFLQNELSIAEDKFLGENLDIKHIIAMSLNKVNQKIDGFYLEKGKFNKQESEIVKKVMTEFSIDLQDGGISRGLYEYLLPYLPELSKENFYSKYHQPLDYLLRLLKQEIAIRLEDVNN